uniref:Uncharacterized protein n=1 Tax=Rhipicephalus zambeziensis TaxID=60191 RepID=A0A224YGN7_9ACAR
MAAGKPVVRFLQGPKCISLLNINSNTRNAMAMRKHYLRPSPPLLLLQMVHASGNSYSHRRGRFVFGCRIRYALTATKRPGFLARQTDTSDATLGRHVTCHAYHFRSLRGGRVPDGASATKTLASVSHARLCTAKHDDALACRKKKIEKEKPPPGVEIKGTRFSSIISSQYTVCANRRANKRNRVTAPVNDNVLFLI